MVSLMRSAHLYQWIRISFTNNKNTRLKDNYIQEFGYSTSSKTSDYRNLYPDLNSYEFHNYLDKITNTDHRKTLIKLRTGNNCLFTEKGRYESIDRQERFFPLCSKEVEDLKHFIFKCEILRLHSFT